MNVYMASFFNEEALSTPLFRLSSLPNYVIPEDGPLSSYREVCAGLPPIDLREVYGQHANPSPNPNPRTNPSPNATP